jgi:hypothetical protein
VDTTGVEPSNPGRALPHEERGKGKGIPASYPSRLRYDAFTSLYMML